DVEERIARERRELARDDRAAELSLEGVGAELEGRARGGELAQAGERRRPGVGTRARARGELADRRVGREPLERLERARVVGDRPGEVERALPHLGEALAVGAERHELGG